MNRKYRWVIYTSSTTCNIWHKCFVNKKDYVIILEPIGYWHKTLNSLLKNKIEKELKSYLNL